MSARRHHGLVATVIAAIFSAALALPGAAAANSVDDLLSQVGNTVSGLTGGGGGGGTSDAPTPAAGTPPSYVPPEHGTNPHGQGTVGVVDLTPENTAPLPYNPDGGSEDVVVGGSRGEQTGGAYHGHITIASTFLTGEIIGIDTTEGQTDTGPLGALNSALCPANGGGNANVSVCVLAVNSETNGNSSTNHYETAGLNLGGPTGITASAAESNGNISESGSCQTSHGDSHVANAQVGTFTAQALNSSSDSEACRGSAPTQTNDSSVVNLGGTGLGVPAAGCADGTPNTNFTPLAPLTSIVCNADDSNGAQAALPNGVREALSVFVLDVAGTPLLKTTTSAAESQAVAPEAPPPSPPPAGCASPPCGNGGGNNDGGGPSGGNEGEKGGPGGLDEGGPSAAGPGKGSLPFTGTDLVTLALIGLGVMGTGLGTMALADRRRRLAASA
jgi:hypothetical protein